jgi:hypothetical protein
MMEMRDAVVAALANRRAAETAVRKLAGAGFGAAGPGVCGGGDPDAEDDTRFRNDGDWIKFCCGRGAIWGGVWGLAFGGLLMTILLAGRANVLGLLVATMASAVASAIVVGGLSALSAALHSLGAAKVTKLQPEATMQANGLRVTAQGAAGEIPGARAVHGTYVHAGFQGAGPICRFVRPGA